MRRIIFLRCIIIAFLVTALLIGVCEQIQGDISSGIVRLHIIANSDEEHDQQIKLKVRDAIIDSQKEIFSDGIKNTLNKEEREKLLKKSEQVLNEQGVNYKATIETGKFYFPTKKYDNITLPAGNYDAVRVVLGEGGGQNWWCVMYPPLCFADSAVGKADEKSLDILRKSMTEFEYKIISEEDIKVVPAFKLVEIWQNVKKKINNCL